MRPDRHRRHVLRADVRSRAMSRGDQLGVTARFSQSHWTMCRSACENWEWSCAKCSVFTTPHCGTTSKKTSGPFVRQWFRRTTWTPHPLVVPLSATGEVIFLISVEKGVFQTALADGLYAVFKSASNKYNTLLCCHDLSHLKFDHFIEIVEMSNR